MKFSVLCSDLDGTLLTTKSDVSELTITEISRIKSNVKIILVSARMPKGMTYLQKRLGIEHEPIICYNGAYILDNTKVIHSTIIPVSTILKIHALAKVLEIQLGLYYKDEWYVEKHSERVEKEIRYTYAQPVFQKTEQTLIDWQNRNIGAHKIMLMCTKTSADVIFPKLQQQFSIHLNSYRSNDTLIELAPQSVSKFSAIIKLLSNNFLPEDVIAFGDNYNDIEMLQNVGFGVAVGNARTEVKAIANALTLENTSDGVARFIQEHL